MQVAANQRTYHSAVAAYSAALDDDLVLAALTAGMQERQRRRSLVEKGANVGGWGKAGSMDGSMDRSVESATSSSPSPSSTMLLTAQLQGKPQKRGGPDRPNPANSTDRRPSKTKASR